MSRDRSTAAGKFYEKREHNMAVRDALDDRFNKKKQKKDVFQTPFDIIVDLISRVTIAVGAFIAPGA